MKDYMKLDDDQLADINGGWLLTSLPEATLGFLAAAPRNPGGFARSLLTFLRSNIGSNTPSFRA